ncbi:NADP-dependent oxidoreductase [Mycobacteroides abscessus]|nr:NADP-dependent oxidoreductase [Mycobacteroides abscessus]
MRAAVHNHWGSPLDIVDTLAPEPGAGEVRIAVKATSVNPIDMHTGRNAGYEQSMRLPYIPGWDVAGIVDAVGYGVTRFVVGDSVYGLPWFPYPAGTYAQFTTAPAYQLVLKPPSLTYAEAACLPMAALTAWQMLDSAYVAAGHKILISGASGGVGHIAVQMAAHRGAYTIALAQSKHHALLTELGADTCVDYTDHVAVESVGQVDAVIDLVGGKLGHALIDHIRPGGAIALATAWSVKGYQTAASRRGIDAKSCLVEPDPERLNSISALAEAGTLRPLVGAQFDLEHAAQAQTWVLERSGAGKAAIIVGQMKP